MVVGQIHFNTRLYTEDELLVQQQLADLYNRPDVNAALTALSTEIFAAYNGAGEDDLKKKFGGAIVFFEAFLDHRELSQKENVSASNLTLEILDFSLRLKTHPEFFKAEYTKKLPDIVREIGNIITKAPNASALRREIGGSEAFKQLFGVINPQPEYRLSEVPSANVMRLLLNKRSSAPSPEIQGLQNKIAALLDTHNAALQRMTAPYIIKADMDTPEGEAAYEAIPHELRDIDNFAFALECAADAKGFKNTEDFDKDFSVVEVVGQLRALYTELGKQPAPDTPLAPATTQQDRLMLLSIFNEITKTVEEVKKENNTDAIIAMAQDIQNLVPQVTFKSR